MIFLNEELRINQGTVRACYHHPQDRSLLIKVPTGSKKDREQANSIELKAYEILMREHKDLSCISHCYGLESTNHGTGLVCDCIRDSNGSVSKTILDLIQSATPPDYIHLKEILDKFIRFLLKKEIHIFDLNLKNIVLQQQADATYKPIIVDVKGRHELKEFIPISKYIAYFRRRKLERRCRQLRERTKLCWENEMNKRGNQLGNCT